MVDGQEFRLAGAEVEMGAEQVARIGIVAGLARLGVGQGIKERDLGEHASEQPAALQRVVHETVGDHRVVDLHRDGQEPNTKFPGGLAALARGDTVLAIRRFAGLPDSLCGNCYLDKLARVRLLAARGENREAEAVLDQVLHNHDFVSALDGMWALEGGRVYERLGQREKAIANYGFVVDVWRHADPQLQPYVEEARAALKRLGGEPR